MGDRANIFMKQNGGRDAGIYFYTHSSGYNLPNTLQDALKRGVERWDDEQYLGRIIFSEMVKRYVEGVTGYGISTYLCDGGNRILIVDSETKTVGLNRATDSTVPKKTWTFEEFCALDLGGEGEAWRALGKE
jgi:hypothetical protein